MRECISRPESTSVHDHDTPRHRGTEAKLRWLLGSSVPRCDVIRRLSLRTQAKSGIRRVVGITASLLTAAPASALACPACVFVGASDNTWAYRAMSVMLILLPLAMIGATVWWLARLTARHDAERPPATLWEVASDGIVQGTSPTRRGPRPAGLVSVPRRTTVE
jgi:hypothetical protein